jgi:hypothetical protein
LGWVGGVPGRNRVRKSKRRLKKSLADTCVEEKVEAGEDGKNMEKEKNRGYGREEIGRVFRDKTLDQG